MTWNYDFRIDEEFDKIPILGHNRYEQRVRKLSVSDVDRNGVELEIPENSRYISLMVSADGTSEMSKDRIFNQRILYLKENKHLAGFQDFKGLMPASLLNDMLAAKFGRLSQH